MERWFYWLMLACCSSTNAQSSRYFEFSANCGHGNWQDTSFIAVTDNADVIVSALADLDKPNEERRFISGPIDHGNGGFNHNAGHWFLWHFIPGQWELVEFATEVCDGCPYSDVDADTAYWISNIGIFCPWSGKVSREVDAPSGIPEARQKDMPSIFPNPSYDHAVIQINSPDVLHLALYDASGRKIRNFLAADGDQLELSGVSPGIYFIRSGEGKKISLRLVKIGR